MPRPTLPRPTRRVLATAVLATLAADAGCHHHTVARREYDAPPPPQVVTTPAVTYPAKPLPPQGGAALPPPPADPPIVGFQPPEEPRYVQAYDAIQKPKLVVFVNRTVTGELMPVGPSSARGLSADDGRPVVYLRPGQYDEAQAQAIDYELIENLLTEDLSADGKVTVIAPVSARQRLSEDDVREIQAGRPQMLGELATKLNADVLVQVTAHPSQQTDAGLGVRLVAEGLNTHGGQAIAFAAVDVPAPLTKGRLNEYVRFVARKLMDGMSGSWEAMAAPPPAQPNPLSAAAATPAPVTPPASPLSIPTVVIPPTPPAAPPPAPAPAPAPAMTPAMVPATPSGTTRPAANPLDLPPPP